HNIEIKNGLIVRPHTPTVFNPTVSDYYLTIFAPDGNHGILHVTNPHVIKASAPPATWSKQARPLPSSQMVDGMEVTLTGFTPGNYDSFSGQFLIKKNGKDVSSDYGVASWIVDIWGNHSRRQGVLGFPLIHSSYWKVECVLFEYGTAAYTESHLCRLGNLTYPKEQTFTPLNVSWQNKAESLRVSALLGVGRHYFAGNRWLRAEPLPAPSLEQQTPFYGYAWNHTDELDLDENGNNISIRFYDAKMPSLLLHARLSTPIAVVGTNNKWEPNVVKPGITLERGYRVFSSDELHWVDAQPEQIIRLEWAPTIQQQEITLGIAQRREFEFYVTPADILPQAATKEE
ncbi:MAG: hypothetical protein LBV12_09260, partial [Puniceicoccales bacterium]|nr:hypothetical protein [Puniceicoccales bacterium]